MAIEDLTEQRMNELDVVRSLFKADPDLLKRFSTPATSWARAANAVIGAAEAGDINRAIDLSRTEYLAAKGSNRQPATEVVNTAEHASRQP